jgi:hypothetical protein
MVRAPPTYCGGRSVTPRKITAAAAAKAGSRVLVTANSVGVMRLRLACYSGIGYASRWTVSGAKAGTQTEMYSAPSAPGVL